MGADKKTRARIKEAKDIQRREKKRQLRQQFYQKLRNGEFEDLDQIERFYKPKENNENGIQ